MLAVVVVLDVDLVVDGDGDVIGYGDVGVEVAAKDEGTQVTLRLDLVMHH